MYQEPPSAALTQADKTVTYPSLKSNESVSIETKYTVESLTVVQDPV